MQDWPAAFYIAGPARLRTGPGLSGTVAALLERLCVENALITVVSRTCAGNAKLTEPWYGTRFGFRDLRGLRGRLRNAGLGDGLGLPPLNPFLPRSLALKAPRRAPGAFPVPALERTERWDAYFRQDTEHGVPKAYVFVQLLTPLPRGSPELAVAARLYENLVADGLQESLLYYAQVAGLDFNFSISTRGVQLFLGGFDDRLGSFAESALDALLAYKPDPKDFAAQLDVLRRELDSFDSQLPIAQASYWTGLALVVPEIPLEELRRAAAAARPAEVAAFAEQLWRRERLFGTSLCWGNLRQAEADALAAKLQRLDFAPLPPSEWPLPRVAQVPIAPTGPGVVLVHEVMDPAEENSAVELLFQGGSSRGGDPEQMEALAVLQVLASAISDEFYEELRTREQLGYVVSCRADRNEGVFGLLFQVQGAAKSALEVLERIDAFLETVPELLKAKSEAEVAQLADALAEARLARPQSLLGAAQRVWAEIRSREFRWARPAEEALALKKVRKAQVLEAFDTRVASGGALRRRLVSLVVRRGEKARVLAALAKRNAQVIEDLQAFARVQPKWPS
ncbi:unnamed protein product [Effrenium voratum]|uniref:Uncharacterized protein n=1 Tax=Effrenium voratum TaxID=2562239 RepID=A0AA36IJJ0_9DINO|nr:unnamed protein product [Effrenium voratum]